MIMRTEVRQEAEHQDRLSVADIPRICRKCIPSVRTADMDPAEITVITATREVTDVRTATAVMRMEIIRKTTVHMTGMRLMTIHSIPVM